MGIELGQWYQGVQGLWKWGVAADGFEISFWSDDNVLELDDSDGFMTLWTH